jgi:hypothetical protein
MIKLKSLIRENIGNKIEVPKEPGTVPIPSNHLRLYHYTFTDPEIIRKQGLKLSAAKGNTYGEPNMVWASLQEPNNSKTFVEFSMAIDDPRFTNMGSKPSVSAGVEFYKGRNSDFTILGDVNPSEFIAIHLPWHHTYRYLVDNNMVTEVLDGKFDYLIDDKHPNEAKAIMTVKHNFGNSL